jgi:Fe-S-cluster containining protein
MNPCERCGRCCTDFGDLERGGLMLLPWEHRAFFEQARVRGLPFTSEVEESVGELHSGKNLVLLYRVTTQPCIFSVWHGPSHGCAIYEKRPFVCRSFPYRLNRMTIHISSLCPASLAFKVALENSRGESDPSILAAKVYDRTSEAIIKALTGLHERGTIKLNKRALATNLHVDVDLFLQKISHPLPFSSTEEVMRMIGNYRDTMGA